MNTRGKDALRELLAAEYVLGTLRGGARRRFEAWLRSDAELRAVLARWQTHLAPLDECIPAIEPPARVWTGLIERLPVLAPLAPASTGWWQSLSFWRGLAGALGVLAILAVALPFYRTGSKVPLVAEAQAAYIATIEDPKTHEPVAIMTMPASGNEVVLQLTATQPPVPVDRVLQLWMAAPSGAGVVSAGLVPPAQNGAKRVRFQVPDPERLRGSAVLGVSLEPPGGSPSATHVLGFGKWTKLSG